MIISRQGLWVQSNFVQSNSVTTPALPKNVAVQNIRDCSEIIRSPFKTWSVVVSLFGLLQLQLFIYNLQ